MSKAVRSKPPLTVAALDDLPANVVGEIIDGELYVSPRPRSGHANAAIALSSDLYGPFQRGTGGPGGWRILVEPGIELPDAPEIAPDIAGWRRERLPDLPLDEPIRVVPDWVCEVLSPSTMKLDNTVKKRFYARVGVSWLWFLDPLWRTLTVFQLTNGKWLEHALFDESGKIRAEPFTEVELDLELLWPGPIVPAKSAPKKKRAPAKKPPRKGGT